MLNFDQQVQFASALSSSMTDAAAGMLDASSRWFAEPKPSEPTPSQPVKSWYRQPSAPNPFDWTTWAMPTAASTNPWSSYGWTQPSWFSWGMALGQPASINPFMQQGVVPSPFGYQPWAEIASFAGNMAALQSSQQAWASLTQPAKQPDLVKQGWEAVAWSLEQTSAHLDALTKTADTTDAYANYRSSSGHAVAQIVMMDEAALKAAAQGTNPTDRTPSAAEPSRDLSVH